MANAQYQPRLKQVYNETIRKALLEQFKYDNEMQVPRLDKIVLNMGVGEARADSKKPSVAGAVLALIAGQRGVVTLVRGLNPKSFDGRGNYAMGIKEHIIFPEIAYDKVDQIWGMDIIVCTTAETDDEARALLKAFNFPFRQ